MTERFQVAISPPTPGPEYVWVADDIAPPRGYGYSYSDIYSDDLPYTVSLARLTSKPSGPSGPLDGSETFEIVATFVFSKEPPDETPSTGNIILDIEKAMEGLREEWLYLPPGKAVSATRPAWAMVYLGREERTGLEFKRTVAIRLWLGPATGDIKHEAGVMEAADGFLDHLLDNLPNGYLVGSLTRGPNDNPAAGAGELLSNFIIEVSEA